MKKDIDLYDKEAFLKMHAAGKLAAEVLDYITCLLYTSDAADD